MPREILTSSTPRAADAMEELRRLLARMEGAAKETGRLTFGLPGLDLHLPHGGLAFGAVHEIAPATGPDLPAAFGFLIALLGRMPGRTPLLLVSSCKRLKRCGALFGAGLERLGLDPGRLTLVETSDETEALWATEEAVRARGPAAVAFAFGGKLNLKASQRLLHAAREADLPLLVLRPEASDSIPTASTRWRIGAAPGSRSRFGLLAGSRWQVALERCRNGRPETWMLEFDHATHRFGLAAAMADPSLARGQPAKALGRAR